jgi:hypothetical protein
MGVDLFPGKGQLGPDVSEVVKIVAYLALMVGAGAPHYGECRETATHQPIASRTPTASAHHITVALLLTLLRIPAR